jgi:hypothetical protein
VVHDFEAGLEYAEAASIIKSRRKGDAKEYLVRWADDFPDSWESEDNVRRSMVLAFEQQSSALKLTDGQNHGLTESQSVTNAAVVNV